MNFFPFKLLNDILVKFKNSDFYSIMSIVTITFNHLKTCSVNLPTSWSNSLYSKVKIYINSHFSIFYNYFWYNNYIKVLLIFLFYYKYILWKKNIKITDVVVQISWLKNQISKSKKSIYYFGWTGSSSTYTPSQQSNFNENNGNNLIIEIDSYFGRSLGLRNGQKVWIYV